MNVARDAVTELANTVSSDAFALARVLESDVYVDAPSVLQALATASLHLSLSVAEMAKAVEAVGTGVAGAGRDLRHVQNALAQCSSVLIDIVDPVAAHTDRAIR